MSEVSDALEALGRDERSLDEVEQFFRTRQWSRLARGAGQDTDGPPDGSFAEVADAYTAGTISLDQYGVLAAAASAAMKEQQRRARNTPTTDE